MRPFAQTFIGATLVTVVAGIILVYLQPYLMKDRDRGAAPETLASSQQVVLHHPPALKSVAYREDGSTTWRASADGIAIEWNANGTVQRVYSRYSVPVLGSGNVAISDAQTVAEEKAKAAIVRFMGETVTSTRIVTQVEFDLSKAAMVRQSGAETAAGRVDQHALIQSLADVTRSYSAGELTGVAVLDKGYDAESQAAWALVGIDVRTVKSARALRAMTSGGEQ